MTHEELKAKALANKSVKANYDSLEAEFSIIKNLLVARQSCGLSKKDIAEKMGLNESAITKFESSLVSGRRLPSLAMIKKYAETLNCQIEIKLIPNQ